MVASLKATTGTKDDHLFAPLSLSSDSYVSGNLTTIQRRVAAMDTRKVQFFYPLNVTEVSLSGKEDTANKFTNGDSAQKQPLSEENVPLLLNQK